MERGGGMKKKEQQYGCGVFSDLFRLSTARHPLNLPTALHSSLPPLILEISNSSTVPSKFKPWLAIFFPLHIPPMIESVAFSFFLFSIQISLWSAFFFFFANNHPRGEDIRKINKQEVNAWIRVWIRTSIWNWFYLWREKKFLIMNTELWL